MFSDDLLSQIRSQNNIVELVSQFVSLKKSGSGYSGLCPFHDEKTPSFHVHPLKQCYRCFGCNKGGNVFTFVMAMEGMTFPQAVEKLAKRAGVELPKEIRQVNVSARLEGFERERALLEFASKFFHYLLTKGTDYLFARQYLIQRGISEKTVTLFQLGVSPGGWNTLRDAILKRGFTVKEGIEAGLIALKEGGGSYDRFRNRLMFPIRDPKGQTIGFGARVLEESRGDKSGPKYLNSPESALFSKRSTLFGIYENARGIRLRKEAIIVEGYMDVVGLSENGVNNAVAAMGTALTSDHCQQLKKITRGVVTIFDPDSAGENAWQRSVHLFLSAGLLAKDVSLPSDKDPDEYIREVGAEEFYRLCDKAPRQVNKLLKQIASRGALSEQERGKILEDLRPVLQASALLPDRALVLDALSLVLNVSVPTLENYCRQGPFTKGRVTAPETQARSRPQVLPEPSLDSLDALFFTACVENRAVFLSSQAQTWSEGIKHPLIRQTLLLLHESRTPDNLEKQLVTCLHRQSDGNLLNLLSSGVLQDERSKVKFEEVLSQVLKRVNESRLRSLTTQVRLSQRSGDEVEQIRLLDIMSQLRKQTHGERKPNE